MYIHLCLSLSTTPHLQLHLLPRQLKCSDAHSLKTWWVAKADPKKKCVPLLKEKEAMCTTNKKRKKIKTSEPYVEGWEANKRL